jgi:Lar family restriction alleviation protein
MTDKLLPCPFCGQAEPVAVFDENKAKRNGKSDSGYKSKPYYAVVCNVNLNGCGASGGFKRTPQEAITAWNTRPSTQSTREFVDRLVRHQRLLKAKHWARSGWDGIPVEEVEEYRATYAAFTKVIEYIKAWDERMNK